MAEMVIGEKVTLEDGRSSYALLCIRMRRCLCKTEEDAITQARQYISYFPNNYLEKTPLVTPQEPKQFDKTLEQIIPENQNAPFNMKDLINRVIDEGSFYEVKIICSRANYRLSTY